jgi:hypothetical protein
VVAFDAATFPNSRYGSSVPFPQWLARLNKVGLNRVAKHVAPSLPGIGVVVHKGRRSGRTYQTPVNVFRTPDGFVIALVLHPLGL